MGKRLNKENPIYKDRQFHISVLGKNIIFL